MFDVHHWAAIAVPGQLEHHLRPTGSHSGDGKVAANHLADIKRNKPRRYSVHIGPLQRFRYSSSRSKDGVRYEDGIMERNV